MSRNTFLITFDQTRTSNDIMIIVAIAYVWSGLKHTYFSLYLSLSIYMYYYLSLYIQRNINIDP